MKNENIIRALKAARPYLESGYDHFVCMGLMTAEIAHEITPVEYYAAKDYIKELLGEAHETLEEWLETNHGISQYLTGSTVEGYKKMRVTRLAWIDNMIKELSI